MSEENRLKRFMGGGDTGLQINITHQDRNVQIVFDKPVLVLSISPEQALGMAMAILGQIGHVTWGADPMLPPPKT